MSQAALLEKKLDLSLDDLIKQAHTSNKPAAKGAGRGAGNAPKVVGKAAVGDVGTAVSNLGYPQAC